MTGEPPADDRTDQERGHLPSLLSVYPKGFDGRDWARAFASGLRPEASHWGMHYASSFGFAHQTSADSADQHQSLLSKLTSGLARIDLDHIRHNRPAIRSADAIWTMSEREALGLSLFGRLNPKSVIVSEVCYLLDEWPALPLWRRALYRQFLQKADCLLATSPEIRNNIKALLPDANVETYRFGVPVDTLNETIHPHPARTTSQPLNVLMPGNDLRRDWATAVKACHGLDNVRLTLLSKHETVADHAKTNNHSDFVKGRDYRDLVAHYGKTNAVLILSQPNRHGAGLTMMLEAASLGIPLIVVRDATLQSYLDETQVRIVEPQSAKNLAEAIADLRDDPQSALARADRARLAIKTQGLNSKAATSARCQIIANALRRRGPTNSRFLTQSFPAFANR